MNSLSAFHSRFLRCAQFLFRDWQLLNLSSRKRGEEGGGGEGRGKRSVVGNPSVSVTRKRGKKILPPLTCIVNKSRYSLCSPRSTTRNYAPVERPLELLWFSRAVLLYTTNHCSCSYSKATRRHRCNGELWCPPRRPTPILTRIRRGRGLGTILEGRTTRTKSRYQKCEYIYIIRVSTNSSYVK